MNWIELIIGGAVGFCAGLIFCNIRDIRLLEECGKTVDEAIKIIDETKKNIREAKR